MDIIKVEPRQGDFAFTGENVVGQGEVKSVVRDIDAPCEAFSNLIYHNAGSRFQWHTHEIIQIIHVVEGGGWVQVRGEEPVRLEEGDTVAARPGEEHWHGALADRDAVHLVFTMGGHDSTDRSLAQLERDPVWRCASGSSAPATWARR